MAKKNQKITPLSLQEIILRGDADTIRQALEARIQIDTLLEEREAAYRRISELEEQVEGIVGEEGVFPFPEPPVPVASFDAKAAAKKKPTPKAVAMDIDTSTEPTEQTAAPSAEPAASEDAEAETAEESAEESKDV